MKQTHARTHIHTFTWQYLLHHTYKQTSTCKWGVKKGSCQMISLADKKRNGDPTTFPNTKFPHQKKRAEMWERLWKDRFNQSEKPQPRERRTMTTLVEGRVCTHQKPRMSPPQSIDRKVQKRYFEQWLSVRGARESMSDEQWRCLQLEMYIHSHGCRITQQYCRQTKKTMRPPESHSGRYQCFSAVHGRQPRL